MGTGSVNGHRMTLPSPAWSGVVSEARVRRGVFYVGIDGLESLPRSGYIYTISALGTVLYVGSAVNPRRRLLQHLDTFSWTESPVAELGHRYPEVLTEWGIKVYDVGDDRTAERRVIRALRPCLNRLHNFDPEPLPEPLLGLEIEREERAVSALHLTMQEG